MRDLSEDYVNGSKAAARDVFVKIMLNDEEDTVFDTKSLLPISANRSITDGSFGIGFSSSDRLTFSVAAEDKVPKKTRTTLYAAFSKSGTYERLGRFYCESSRRSGNIISVTAFDAMNILRNRTVKFTGISSKDIPELAFPCTMQSVLDYIVAKNGLTCEFVCEDFTVQKKPMKNETEYYSDAEILGFIASSHARNAKFDYEGKLAFVGYTAVDSAFTTSNVIDMSLDDSEPFEVTGLLFKIGDDTIYIDDVEGSEYDEEAEGVLKIENPFASVEIAEYVWSQLGGLKYYGGSITIRGTGIHECGDVITVKNLKNPSDTTEYPFCITSIDYSIGNDGFTEVLSSKVTKSGGTSLSSGGSSSPGGGKTYYAGQGLSLTGDNVFMLGVANQADLGGIRIAGTENVSADDPSAEYGIFKKTYDGFPALRTALSYQKGGFFLGDGFVPELEEKEKYGEIYYSPNGYVRLRIGEGLEFVDNDEAATDPKELKENSTGGRKVTVPRATGEKYGTVKIGQWLGIDENGFLRVNMKPKRGIDISALGEISVLIDDETIKLNDDGKLASIGVTVENGIVISEADASYLLHEYEEVKYVKGNKIGYAGAQNQIIVQGLIVYKQGGTAPNGVTITGGGSRVTDESLLPDMPLYTDFSFTSPTHRNNGNYEVSRVLLRLVSSATTHNNYQQVYVKDDGTEVTITSFNNYDGYTYGWFLLWTNIYPPGYVDSNGITYPFGCATCAMFRKYKSSATQYYLDNGNSGTNALNIGFASEAEYNAAVGLTYEPITLTNVEETVTEV